MLEVLGRHCFEIPTPTMREDKILKKKKTNVAINTSKYKQIFNSTIPIEDTCKQTEYSHINKTILVYIISVFHTVPI